MIAEKLERLAARIRRRQKDSSSGLDDQLKCLEATLDAMLIATDNDLVLPSKHRLAPVVKDRSARQAMMPTVKTRKVRAGDPAYGGGQTSGGKAKKAKLSKAPKAPLPEISSSLQPLHLQLTPLLTPPIQLPYSTAYQPTTSTVPPQPYSYPPGLYQAWPHPVDRT
jgi:hypothetical protein